MNADFIRVHLRKSAARNTFSFSMQSGEQNVASPDFNLTARSAGIHVPHLSHRTSLFFEGVRSGDDAVVTLTPVTAFSDCATLRMSLR